MAEHILVTGGAGYIGSHACAALAQRGFTPVAFDNLSTGWRDAVQFGPLVHGDLLDPSAIAAAFDRFKPVAVMHFAGLSLVGQAAVDPGAYWRVNVMGALNLLQAMVAAGCDRLVFSSTCAIFGDANGDNLHEGSKQNPLNAYGASKRAIENMLDHFAQAHGLRAAALRYFNVAGADPQARIGECHRPETHLIPLAIAAAAQGGDPLTVFGTDYPTPDGTCIRDYLHVSDLIDAHLLALDHLAQVQGAQRFNLGTGQGASVMQVLQATAQVLGRPVPHEFAPRRAGDAVRLVSGSDRAARILGWQAARSTLPQMIEDAARWYQTGGYQN